MTIEKMIDKAITLIAMDLGLNIVPEVRYLRNYQEGTFGMVFESVPNVIFLDLPQIDKHYESNAMANFHTFKTLCHEARHIWQLEEGWEYNFDMSYELNPCEIDAEDYADSIVMNLINEVLADVV